MKQLMLLATFCVVFWASADAQLRKIPAEATSAMKSKFPEAQKVEWRDKLTYFEANFEDKGIPTTATFSSKGEWQQTERGFGWDEIPEAIKEGFSKSKYADEAEWKLGETITRIVKSDGNTLYRVYVDKIGGIQKKYLYFNTSGQMEKESFTL